MGLIQFLRSNKNTRKVFGQRELKIIEKQLLGINLTQSEKNRLSRDIRKKFEFIKSVSSFSDEFGLKKGNDIKEKVERAKEIILKSEYFPKIKQILLFGSSVKNEVTFRSDIDIAVKFDKIDVKEATKFRIYVAGRVSDKIDIQVYNILPDKIKTSILKNHKVLYKNESKYYK